MSDHWYTHEQMDAYAMESRRETLNNKIVAIIQKLYDENRNTLTEDERLSLGWWLDPEPMH